MQKFEFRAKAHVRKIFRVRRTLIDQHIGHDTAMMRSTLDKLERLFGFYPYASDVAMANFVFNHSAELSYLTPGNKSGLHQSMMKELDVLLNEASTLIAKRYEPVR